MKKAKGPSVKSEGGTFVIGSLPPCIKPWTWTGRGDWDNSSPLCITQYIVGVSLMHHPWTSKEGSGCTSCLISFCWHAGMLFTLLLLNHNHTITVHVFIPPPDSGGENEIRVSVQPDPWGWRGGPRY